jgi:N-acetylglucosamine-6-phosphate deacetylase
MRNAVQHLGVALETAVAMASMHAARAMRLDDRYGAIEAGSRRTSCCWMTS